jgi:hypothetical protein
MSPTTVTHLAAAERPDRGNVARARVPRASHADGGALTVQRSPRIAVAVTGGIPLEEA